MENASAKEFVMDHPDSRFNDASCGVAATEFERIALREQFKGRISWVDDPESLIVNIGNLGGIPLLYTFHWAVINGCRVVFYQSSGDFDAKPFFKKWLHSIGPDQIVTAINFHQVILTVTNGKGLSVS